MWHFVVGDGALSHAGTGGRALVFCVRPRRIVTKRGSRTFGKIMTGPSFGIKSALRDEGNRLPGNRSGTEAVIGGFNGRRRR